MQVSLHLTNESHALFIGYFVGQLGLGLELELRATGTSLGIIKHVGGGGGGGTCSSAVVAYSAPSLESPLSIRATISLFQSAKNPNLTLCLVYIAGILRPVEFAMRQCV